MQIKVCVCESLIYSLCVISVKKSFEVNEDEGMFSIFRVVEFGSLPIGAIFGAMGLGFCLSLLFFMDQNISAALVNAPQNK